MRAHFMMSSLFVLFVLFYMFYMAKYKGKGAKKTK